MGKKIQCIGRYVMDGVTLGKGNFARVELATHGVTACKVAIKIIDTRKIKEEYVRQNLHREARILGQLRHPNIVRLYETLKATTLYCIVLECASGGNLLAYIKTFKDFLLPEERARPYLRQLVSAVHYLHEKGVAHSHSRAVFRGHNPIVMTRPFQRASVYQSHNKAIPEGFSIPESQQGHPRGLQYTRVTTPPSQRASVYQSHNKAIPEGCSSHSHNTTIPEDCSIPESQQGDPKGLQFP
ncbi:hormonally up-regulated neu tumor-associated kinase-like [Mizuhopecten yessoensis]|uniref:hormonally up-regulated neu tumor-associated kinase-like n=1 Tax=Mizuhopecten yessoensis TaxID=6573 RepID=UPI000B457305|nr:hormonally up-regulated neu tumor-associated kinase-like [Mizuhopecten yessoensis]